jgi:hypothetical protein
MGTGSLLAVVLAAATLGGGRIVAEWEPGITSADVGGPIVVDDYGVSGLGAYRVQLDDGTVTLAVCIQADVGHSLAARYEPDPATPVPAELAYLAWAHLARGAPDDTVAAAINVLAWRYTDAQRRGGGAVWRDGAPDVRALGIGHLVDIEQAIDALHAEAAARRGPWALTADGPGRVHLDGPGGPIAGITVHFEAAGWSADAVTDVEGVAAFVPPDGEVRASVAAPGSGVVLVAPGSQRLAIAGPDALVVALVPAPPTTTSTTTTTIPPTTSTTATSTTTASTPTTSSTTATVPTTTAPPTSSPSTTTTAPPATTAPPGVPPQLPPTGAGSRNVTRVGAWLFALGALLTGLGRRRAQ